MSVAKVIVDDTTIMDITDTTATASDVASGKYFYLADGIKTEGTVSGGGGDLAKLCNNTLTSYTITTNSVKEHTFRAATALTSVSFTGTNVAIGTYSFYGTRLQTVVIPSVGSFGTYAFAQLNADSTLKSADFNHTGSSASMANNMFSNESGLETLVLRRTSGIVSLGNINTFVVTPFASGKSGGTLYVPSSYLSGYKSATNWSTVIEYANNMILPIEGSYYQTHYADDTDISGSSYSEAKYWLLGWYEGVTSAEDLVALTKKKASRGTFIALRGEHPIRLNTSTGKNTHIYPIEIPSGVTGFTVTSSSLDFYVTEWQWNSTDWERTTASSWLLQSDSNSHSYTIAHQNTTHITINVRVAGDTEDTGTVTQAMLDAITFSWNN